ncbi:MAG: hypothetical protein JSW71_20990 [Gemmatimonadota bacterium]|nr:MAG: hypothetical protein JSW71_20990 [Gemmatimonadota bacterium]
MQLPSPKYVQWLALAAIVAVPVMHPIAPASAQTGLERAATALEWRNIGPAIMGGRVSDLAVVESNPAIFYVGTATGGVWKTTNHGTTWQTIFDDQPTSSVGDVTLAPSNPNIVWVGTGEPQNRQSSPWGNGVYKSTDAGRTWTHMGLDNTHHIARIQIHPLNPDVVYVAAVGHLWGPNPERGVYKSVDGGTTWDLVLFVDENTGAIDLAMDPGDPETLFAAMYQRRRTGFGFSGGGPGSGLYRTTDGGANWQELTNGLPEGDKGRIGIDIYRRDGNIVFAQVEARQGRGVYRSLDRGETWEFRNETNNRPMYYSQIRVDPNDPERVYAAGANLYRSSDGGKTFTADAARGVHSDHHALWINPANSNHLILGGDGGVDISYDRSDNWRQINNMILAQFYEIGVDMRDPYYVCGGLQDNGSWCGPSNTLSNQGIRNRDWYNVGSGDGFYTLIDPSNPDIMFAESQGGNVFRVDLKTMERTTVRPSGRPDEEGEMPRFRWNWDTPIVMSSHDPATIYVGANVLFKSTDRGFTWEQISPDLTKQLDRDTMEIMGVRLSRPALSRNDGISTYGNMTAISESPLTRDLVYVGTDDGNVQVTRDGGATWSDLTGNFRGLPERTYVSRVVASRHAEGRVYAAFDGHRNDDFDPYAYVSEDYGASWTPIVEGLPGLWSVNIIAEHPRQPNLLFLGNEIGVYYSINRGASWTRLMNNLPTVPVDDIIVHPRDNDLVIGTHGRGIWIMDDITPLEELSQEVLASAAHLFSVRSVSSYTPYTPQGWTPGALAAPNPPHGARIRYYLSEDIEPAATAVAGSNGPNVDTAMARLTILDASGAVVRELDGPGAAGGHEVIWDLRLPRPYEPDPGQQGGFFGAPPGPKVLPATYTVRLDAAGQSMTADLEVRLDPRVEISRADLQARQDALMSMYVLAKPLYDAGRRVRELNEQLTEIQDLLRDNEAAPESLGEAATDITTELGAISRELGQASRGARASYMLEGSTTRPSPDVLFQIDRAWEQVPGLIERLNEVITTQIPALYAQLNDHGIRPSPGEALEVPRRP